MGFTQHIKVLYYQNCSNMCCKIIYTKSSTKVSSIYFMEKTKHTCKKKENRKEFLKEFVYKHEINHFNTYFVFLFSAQYIFSLFFFCTDSTKKAVMCNLHKRHKLGIFDYLNGFLLFWLGWLNQNSVVHIMVPECHYQPLSLFDKHISQAQICNVITQQRVQPLAKAEGMFQW